MITEVDTQDPPTLSERCRIALEKSYGFKIPMPKSVRKAPKET
ncbi:MAG TPA: hypothetical protein VLU95_00450 [Candidatus Acidoferrum sp.]|nr:hypothetical protein [Candidatus Acidoferrum sp.]